MTSPLALILIALVRVYQRLVSPFLRATMGPVCRFEPSCSHYAAACLEAHGAWRGGLLSLVRVCKCHPFHPGGYDPPPPRPLVASPPASKASPSIPRIAAPSLTSPSVASPSVAIPPVAAPHSPSP